MHLLANRLSFFFGIKIHFLFAAELPICSRNAETPKTVSRCMVSGRFWAFSFDMSGFVLAAVSFTANHSKAAVCHFRVTKKRRIATTLLSCSAYFVAGVLGIPLVHYVEERGEVVILRFVAVHAVIDCNKAYLLLGEQNLGIKADLKIVSAETAHILDDNCADFPGFGFCKHCLKSGTVEVTPCVTVIFQKIVCKKFVILKIHINCNLCYSIEK